MEKRLLPLVDKADYSLGKWVESESNKIATASILRIKQEKIHKFICICGPKGSGKTHLSCIFKTQNSAVEFTAADVYIPGNIINTKYRDVNFFVFDNIEWFNEKWLFDLFNTMKSKDAYALFTIGKSVAEWHFRLQDLSSRLKSTNIINIALPDDNLLTDIIIKQSQDHGVYIDHPTIEYLIQRIPRNFESVLHWVKRLNEYSLVFGKKISKSLISHLLRDVRED
jgi:chromosomal replication initiation ATPase DnaA